MKPASKNLLVFGFALIFAAAVWCASLAAPGQALASVTGCSQSGGHMKMNGCAQVLCRLESSANLLSQGALASARVHAWLKGALGVVDGGSATALADGAVLLASKAFVSVFSIRPDKVSIRLFNSVLNL